VQDTQTQLEAHAGTSAWCGSTSGCNPSRESASCAWFALTACSQMGKSELEFLQLNADCLLTPIRLISPTQSPHMEACPGFIVLSDCCCW
jgi:hypothetical protein